MRFTLLLSVGILAPITGFAYPTSEVTNGQLDKRENLCSYKTPPVICQANSSVTVEETAARAYKFYRAFVVDGDPRTMFSLIDSTYKVRWCILIFFLAIQLSRFSDLCMREAVTNTRFRNSNITQDMPMGQTPFGRFSATETKSEPRKTQHGVLMLAQTCHMRNIQPPIDGVGSMGVSTNM